MVSRAKEEHYEKLDVLSRTCFIYYYTMHIKTLKHGPIWCKLVSLSANKEISMWS